MSCKVCGAFTNSETEMCPECLIDSVEDPEVLDPYTDDEENTVTEDLDPKYLSARSYVESIITLRNRFY